MEFTHISFVALLCLVIVGIDASQSGEEYWKSVWPNTPLPKALLDLLLPDKGISVPIGSQEEKQYWTVFFEHDLYPGKKMSLGIQKNSEIQLLTSREQVSLKKSSQPFGINVWWDQKSSERVSQTFGVHTWGKKDTHILHDYCWSSRAIGEDKHCAPSLESMMNFSISKLGKNIKVMSSSFAQNQNQYVVEEVKKIGDRAVMCHRLNFEKVVFYCHQGNSTTTFMVSLMAFDGTKSKALTICHHDTRGMNPDMLYKVLKVVPGTIPICHFIGNKAIAWVPIDAVSDSVDHSRAISG
ncbi:embryonic abundant protein VF30.1-like [Cicer arietinum]|uniref:Embryonic abundant protein VF30.1-like n=1 Tax=Cicer arietinum TaxID=3827 RepID=A0A1S2YWT5_CICAR|nr:embryonic abundant protein VF30.1-like [Cicer arietinum]